jgi:transposase
MGFPGAVEGLTILRQQNAGADMTWVADHLSVTELQAGYRGSKEAMRARHYQVIWLLAQGRTVAETARLTGFVPRWVEELLVRYNRFGPSSLGDRRRANGARPRILTPEILDLVRERVKAPPEDGGVWTSRKVAAMMAAELGLTFVAEQRGWEALRAIGWTLQKPRPRHARAAGPEEQAEFKKTSPKPLLKRQSATPAR